MWLLVTTLDSTSLMTGTFSVILGEVNSANNSLIIYLTDLITVFLPPNFSKYLLL